MAMEKGRTVHIGHLVAAEKAAEEDRELDRKLAEKLALAKKVVAKKGAVEKAAPEVEFTGERDLEQRKPSEGGNATADDFMNALSASRTARARTARATERERAVVRSAAHGTSSIFALG